MGFSSRSLAMIGLLTLLVICLPSADAIPREETEERLLARIERERNPVKKIKLEIRLARLKFSQASEAYDKGEFARGQQLLETYLARMKSAWQTIQSSGRRATKRPQGFRDLEIALREDGRFLKDLQRRVPYFNRAPVEKIAEEAEGLRSEVIRALFPVEEPARKGTRAVSGNAAAFPVPEVWG